VIDEVHFSNEGEWAVRTVAPNPTYTYDPSRLTFGNNCKLMTTWFQVHVALTPRRS
jgi:hypothetical protein